MSRAWNRNKKSVSLSAGVYHSNDQETRTFLKTMFQNVIKIACDWNRKSYQNDL